MAAHRPHLWKTSMRSAKSGSWLRSSTPPGGLALLPLPGTSPLRSTELSLPSPLLLLLLSALMLLVLALY
jgi:hypothetical protein